MSGRVETNTPPEAEGSCINCRDGPASVHSPRCVQCGIQRFLTALEQQSASFTPPLRGQALQFFHHTVFYLTPLFSFAELIVGAVYSAQVHYSGTFLPLEVCLPACRTARLCVRDTHLVPLALLMRALMVDPAQATKQPRLHPENYRVVLLTEIGQQLKLAPAVCEAAVTIFRETHAFFSNLVATGELLGGAIYLAIRTQSYEIPRLAVLERIIEQNGLTVQRGKIRPLAVILRTLTKRRVRALRPQDCLNAVLVRLRQHPSSKLQAWLQTQPQIQLRHQAVQLVDVIPAPVRRTCGSDVVVCLAVVEASRRLASAYALRPLTVSEVAEATGQAQYKLIYHQPLLMNFWRKDK